MCGLPAARPRHCWPIWPRDLIPMCRARLWSAYFGVIEARIRPAPACGKRFLQSARRCCGYGTADAEQIPPPWRRDGPWRPGLVDRLLGHLQGEQRLFGDPFGHGQGGGQQIIAGHRLVDHAQLARFLAPSQSTVNSNSLALRTPTSQGWAKNSTPQTPIYTTGSRDSASSEAIMISQAQASIRPPAMHLPCTAAMVGLGKLRQRSVMPR